MNHSIVIFHKEIESKLDCLIECEFSSPKWIKDTSKCLLLVLSSKSSVTIYLQIWNKQQQILYTNANVYLPVFCQIHIQLCEFHSNSQVIKYHSSMMLYLCTTRYLSILKWGKQIPNDFRDFFFFLNWFLFVHLTIN